jgi:hypothetical protein
VSTQSALSPVVPVDVVAEVVGEDSSSPHPSSTYAPATADATII